MSSIRNLLFPTPAREFKGQRWINMSLRSLHLIGIAGVAGGLLFGLDKMQWSIYWHLALGSGILLCLLYLWSSLLWLFQLKGLSIVIKLLLLWLAFAEPAIRVEAFILVIFISGMSAHAPGQVRGWVWLPVLRAGSGSISTGNRHE